MTGLLMIFVIFSQYLSDFSAITRINRAGAKVAMWL